MMTPETRIKELQSFISRMPSLSTTVSKVLEICNDASASPNDLNRVISLDPVLTGQVLKLINSAYYGFPSRITSLTRAIIMLGLNTVKNLVLSTSILASFKACPSLQRLPIDEFWTHSLCVGVTAKFIAKTQQVAMTEQEEFFVSGLLHDLGKLPLMACFAERYDQAMDQAAAIPDRTLCMAEQEVIGIDHCQVGMLIAARWKLNTQMRQAIMNHHQPLATQQSGDTLLLNMSLANQLTLYFRIGFAGDPLVDATLLQSLADLSGLSMETLSSLRSRIEEEIEKARVFLEIGAKG